MATDILKTYLDAQQQLVAEKVQLEKRLQQIDQVLRGQSVATPKIRRRQVTGGRTGLSLREAVLQVTSKAPMAKKEIVAAVKKIGYRTASKNPVNLLNPILYGDNPPFKNVQGKYSPVFGATGKAAPKAAPAKKAAKPAAPRKRTMSPAARRKLSAATTARWAKVKAAGKKAL